MNAVDMPQRMHSLLYFAFHSHVGTDWRRVSLGRANGDKSTRMSAELMIIQTIRKALLSSVNSITVASVYSREKPTVWRAAKAI